MDLDAIFKAYDVRGTVPDQLDDEAARRIGAAFADFAGSERIAVGRDVRTSSPVLAAALIAGVLSRGVGIDDLGMITTDMVYFAAGELDEPGVMITASHNPKGYNGIKLCLAGAAPVGVDTGLDEVRRLAAEDLPAREPGVRRSVDILDRYVDHMVGIVGSDAIGDLRVAVDGGNGTAGVAIPALFDRIPAHLIPLYLDPDGTFPNHHPDPLRPENLLDLEDLIEEESPAVGVAFDGDADRAFFIDDRGQVLPGSTMTAMVAAWYLSNEPGATIVHNLICSQAVPEIIRERGGTPVRTRVGHSFIKTVMKETGAVFGGEHSGHYYFRDHYRADSGILAMLILLRLITEDGRPLSEIRSDFERYAQSGEINLEVSDQWAAIEAVSTAFGGEQDRLDGLTVTVGDRWFNLRPSNTEPVLRLNVEAPDEDSVGALVEAVRSVVEEVSRAGAA
ncbi:MAG: phosphomannomutase/phosphoglucomutase [Actinomycetota bacterium]|jgi:phosphomannomutase|nr:phosphomannomutase/phosphoglucomutase [Actinomycetota bacterium]